MIHSFMDSLVGFVQYFRVWPRWIVAVLFLTFLVLLALNLFPAPPVDWEPYWD